MRDLYLPAFTEGPNVLAGGQLVGTVKRSKFNGLVAWAGFVDGRMVEPSARATEGEALAALLGWMGAVTLVDDVPTGSPGTGRTPPVAGGAGVDSSGRSS